MIIIRRIPNNDDNNNNNSHHACPVGSRRAPKRQAPGPTLWRRAEPCCLCRALTCRALPCYTAHVLHCIVLSGLVRSGLVRSGPACFCLGSASGAVLCPDVSCRVAPRGTVSCYAEPRQTRPRRARPGLSRSRACCTLFHAGPDKGEAVSSALPAPPTRVCRGPLSGKPVLRDPVPCPH